MELIIDPLNLNSNNKAATIYRHGALNYIYGCCHCTSLFQNISEILDHIETHFDDVNGKLEDNYELNKVDSEADISVELFEPEQQKENYDQVLESNGDISQNSNELRSEYDLCEQRCDTQVTSRHLDDHEHRCKFCNNVYSTSAKFFTHLTQRHLNATKLKCSICSENFACKTKFQRHLMEHIVRKDISYVLLVKDIVLQCENSKEICVKLEVEKCIQKPDNVQLLQCDICKSNFDTKIKLTLHMKDLHMKEAVEKRGMYMCDKCNQNIQGKFLFYAHQYEHLTGGDRFDSISDVALLDNLKTFLDANIQFDQSTPETPYGCKICCHLSVKRRKNIETHILQEHVHRLQCKKRSEKRYPCEYCGAKFTLSHNLIVHKRIHTLERPYTCSICNKSFSHSSYMKYHEKVHSGVRSHQCSTCGLSFKSNTKLNMHTKVHSTDTTRCPICDKEFKPHRLNVHIKHVHENEHRPYTCTVCLQSFKTSKTLKTHSYRHSGEKKYECRFHCNERFTSTAGRRGHERSKHETH